MARLPYETKGGQFSQGETFAQLTEYLRLAAEACYVIGHFDKACDDTARGEGFLTIGKNLEKMRHMVTMLRTSGRVQ